MVKLLRITRGERHIFIEAACETLWVRIVTTFRDVWQYASWLGQSRKETDRNAFDTQRQEQVAQIKLALTRCRHLRWSRKCLVEAVAAKRMLNRRQIPATLYLGVAKNETGKLIAHAWLRSGNIWVSGGRNRHRFVVVGVFS